MWVCSDIAVFFLKLFLKHILHEHQTDLTFARVSQVFDYIMVAYEKIYLKANIKSKYI